MPTNRKNDMMVYCSFCGKSQEEVKKITVKGKVVDEKGEMLPGVTVLLKGTTVGIVTDIDGKFKIELPKRDTMILVFTFVGMKSHELNVGNGT